MAPFRRTLALAFVCLASLCAAQRSDQLAAADVLGPRWKQMSRASGMIFSGTILKVETQPFGKERPIPLILIRFRVDRAIAGVRPGQVVTVREWAGAWSTHRAMRGGQRLLIFLYPPSRLGLTSPVGGPMGQIALDAQGEIVRTPAAKASLDSAVSVARLKSCPPENLRGVGVLAGNGVFPTVLKRPAAPRPILRADCTVAAQPIVTLRQLERAIRDARENASAAPARTKE